MGHLITIKIKIHQTILIPTYFASISYSILIKRNIRFRTTGWPQHNYSGFFFFLLFVLYFFKLKIDSNPGKHKEIIGRSFFFIKSFVASSVCKFCTGKPILGDYIHMSISQRWKSAVGSKLKFIWYNVSQINLARKTCFPFRAAYTSACLSIFFKAFRQISS